MPIRLSARVVEEELTKWPAGEAIDIVPHINILMKNLASQGLFRDPDILAGIHAAEMVERHGRLSGASVTSVIAAKYGGPGSSRLHRQAQATYNALVDWGASRKGVKPTSDILSAIVNSPDENGQPASADRIAGYGWTMLGASYDTSTSILSWLIVFLSTHPLAARKLHDELLASGWRPGSDISALMDLPYLDAVIKEALRLIPPAPIQRRKAAADTELQRLPRDGRNADTGQRLDDQSRFGALSRSGTVRSRSMEGHCALALSVADLQRWPPALPRDLVRSGLSEDHPGRHHRPLASTYTGRRHHQYEGRCDGAPRTGDSSGAQRA